MSFVQKQQGHFSLDLDEARNGLRAFAAQVAQCEGGLVVFFSLSLLSSTRISLSLRSTFTACSLIYQRTEQIALLQLFSDASVQRGVWEHLEMGGDPGCACTLMGLRAVSAAMTVSQGG